MPSVATRPPRLRSKPAGARRTLTLFTRWQQRADASAREELYQEFMPLARKLASRYRTSHEPFEDVVQVASVGLLGAIDRFDPERGTSFPAFAIPTILGELRRYFRDTGWAVHVPRGAQELALRVDHAVQQITADTGRAPRIHAIAEYLEISLEDVLIGLEAGTAHYAVSLDAPVAGGASEEPQPLSETLGCHDDLFGLIETRLWLQMGIGHLPYLERQALCLRLEGGMKQTEIAQAMGCSQMQVSRLLRRAADHLREQNDPHLRDR